MPQDAKNKAAKPETADAGMQAHLAKLRDVICKKEDENRVKTICDRLNAVLKADPAAVTQIVEMRVFCDEKVETDSPAIPHLDAGEGPEGEKRVLSLGALGLINALVTPDWRIVANFDDATSVVTAFTYRKDGA